MPLIKGRLNIQTAFLYGFIFSSSTKHRFRYGG